MLASRFGLTNHSLGGTGIVRTDLPEVRLQQAEAQPHQKFLGAAYADLSPQGLPLQRLRLARVAQAVLRLIV
jgi:hypothetical protein